MLTWPGRLGASVAQPISAVSAGFVSNLMIVGPLRLPFLAKTFVFRFCIQITTQAVYRYDIVKGQLHYNDICTGCVSSRLWHYPICFHTIILVLITISLVLDRVILVLNTCSHYCLGNDHSDRKDNISGLCDHNCSGLKQNFSNLEHSDFLFHTMILIWDTFMMVFITAIFLFFTKRSVMPRSQSQN